MKKYFLIVTMIMCSMIWVSSASADLITEVGVAPPQAVNVHITGFTGSPTFTNGLVYAGIYKLLIAGIPADSYCIDEWQYSPSVATDYVIQNLPSDLKYKQSAYIMQNYANPVDAQVAIWEIISGDAKKGTGLSEGNFYVITDWSGPGATGSLAGAQAIVNDVLGLDLSSFDASGFKLAYNASNQDYIIRATPVPEPTTILLLGFGLIGVAVVRKRLKR